MLQVLDADAVRRWYRGGLVALAARRAEIDALNVYPVPDADTGTNLYFTMRSAVEAAGGAAGGVASGVAPERARPAVLAKTALIMARQSLLGARGSSGVILSQLLRGVGEVLAAERRPPRGLGLTRALERAVELAYAAVSHPVEGTMLTVAGEAARAARGAASDDLATVVGAAATAARQALARTPEQLDVLRRAGVVDAGGLGVVVLLDVLHSIVAEVPLPALPAVASPAAHPDLPTGAAEPIPAWEVMYLIDVDDERVGALREALDRIGNAVVVSGGDGLWNVHVHTDEPEAAVAAGTTLGRPRDVKVRSLAGPREEPGGRAVAVVMPAGPELVAATHLLAGSGAHVIGVAEPDGSQRLARALASSGAADCIVVAVGPVPAVELPEPAIAAATVQVAGVPGLLAAVAVHDARLPLEQDAAAMADAAAATRSASIRPDDGDACAAALRWLDGELPLGGELVTIISDADTAARVADALPRAWPSVETHSLPVDGIAGHAFVGVE